jgi:hypothetical protein
MRSRLGSVLAMLTGRPPKPTDQALEILEEPA